MSAGRTYNVSFEAVACTAVQDLIAVYAGASMAFEVVSINLGQVTATTVALLNLSLKHLPATVTAGSVGTAATPRPDTPTDAAATVTARVNDTTQATSSGTVTTMLADVFNVVNGYQWIFPANARPTCKLSEAMVLSLNTAPATLTISGTMKIRELF